jgi:hemerythrin-like metal-binding protein
MSSIAWKESLVLGVAAMDETHVEFVQLLAQLEDADSTNALQLIDNVIAHTEAHFTQEQHWMTESQFPMIGCHLTEHEGVLGAVREARKYVAEGKVALAKVLAQELSIWLDGHAATMDNMLAQWLREKAYPTQKVASVASVG